MSGDDASADVLEINPGLLAYLLAQTRRGPYYFGTVVSVKGAASISSGINQFRTSNGEQSLWDPAALVWFEDCRTAEAAMRRIAQIRAWPLRWQRRLVEASNPDWMELSRVHWGCPREFWYQVPEVQPLAEPARCPLKTNMAAQPDDYERFKVHLRQGGLLPDKQNPGPYYFPDDDSP